jgi:serine/threonine-protein kinase
MTQVVLDAEGRLLTLHVVPPQKDGSAASPAPDWSPLFKLAGLDQTTFHEVTPEWMPRGQSDARRAWEGAMPGLALPIRVEAAAWRGQPIYFQVIAPWTRPERMEEVPVGRAVRLLNALAVAATGLLLGASVLVARMNVRAGRGDWAGAWRLAGLAVVAQLVTWALNDPHVGNAGVEMSRFFSAIGEALFAGGLLFGMYLAVEPAVRRYWPDGLLGWTRLLQGRFVDARVGRDVLIGLTAGAVMQMLIELRDPLQWLAGAKYPAASFGNTRYFEGTRYVLGWFSSLVGFQAMFSAMWCIFAIVGLKRLLGRTSLVFVAAVNLFTFIEARDLFVGAPGYATINILVAFAVVATLTIVALRVGLLATAAGFLSSFVLSATPWTFDSTAWYFAPSMTALLFLGGLAVFCGYAAGAPAAASGSDKARSPLSRA